MRADDGYLVTVFGALPVISFARRMLLALAALRWFVSCEVVWGSCTRQHRSLCVVMVARQSIIPHGHCVC